MAKLPAKYKALTNAPAYPVELSQKLQELTETAQSADSQKRNKPYRLS